MVKNPENLYNGFTLMEVLVVMSIFIILGGMGTYAFGGLRDSVVVNQDISNLKMDIQRAQHSAMLLRRESGENYWPYGIGIDFSKLKSEGKYSFFKWTSDYTVYDESTMGSELVAFTDGELISGNGYLCLSDCTPQRGKKIPLSGFEDTYIKGGYDVALGQFEEKEIQYLLFESVTGRAFLYNSDGYPVNYTYDNTTDTLVYNPTPSLSIEIIRGQRNEVITVAPGSGSVTHTTVEN